MAVVIRPPLYVPRPADEPFWQGPSPIAALTIALVASVTTMYGAKGQPPTPQWRYDHVPDPVWTWTPPPVSVARLSAASGVPFVPGKWNFNYDQNPGLWSWTDTNGSQPLLQLLTLTTVFAAPGQVPTKQWHYDYDSTVTPWSFNYQRNILLDQPNTPTVPVQWPGFSYEQNAPIWSWTPPAPTIATPTVFTTFYGAPGQVPTKDWSPFYNFAQPETFWSWAGSIRPADVLFIPPGGEPRIPLQWPGFNYDQTPQMWSWSAQRSTPLAPLLTNLGQVPTKDWQAYYNYDVTPAIWTWRTPQDRTANLLPPVTTFYGRPGQVVAHQWNYNYDVTVAHWQFEPVKGFMANVPGPPQTPQQLTSTNQIQLPVNCILDYLQPRQGEPAGIPPELLKRIFGE